MLNSITKKWTKSNKPRDSTDASPISTLTDLEYSESSSEFEILSCKSSIHDDAYNLEYGEKRLLIFNQTKFPCYDTCPNDREGVEQDTQAIKDTFNPLGFFIQEHENLTVAQIKHELLSLSSMDNLSCLMIFISTHGEENDVLYLSLAGKPKVVFVQACQGSKKDKGILIKYRKSNIHEVDGHGSARQIHKMSTHVDFLLVKSSYHGYFSFRSNTSGSWFIQTVCNEIGKSSPTDDLLSIMPRVIQNVSLNYTSCHEDPAIDQCKQTPMLEVTLLRKIYLKSLDIVESSEANLNSDEYPLTESKNDHTP
ncbi:CASP7 [Lepeophtheirus salmonis]|uniref:CASP7 n=1 Tax=Lepeophtheirus salmonis TaxID=72036 RepID=A0A7R8CTQ2_LEPSM|nr:CASP7 [Lepeophtheirus salmonis]CAF2928315.1 CASP7 [Lepeophtheirus salmonis]